MRLLVGRRWPTRERLHGRSAHTALEFAIVIPAVVLLLALLVEGSIHLLTAAVLEYGLREATRFGITGLAYPASMSANPPATREAAITQIIASAGIGLINASYLGVTLTNYANFSVVGTPTAATPGAGGPSAVVQYKVTYLRPWLFSGPLYPPALLTGLPGFRYNLSRTSRNQ
jgi:Flp pilus assembly protein TadG